MARMKRRSLAALVAIAALPLVLNLRGGTPSSPAFRFTRGSGSFVETVLGWMVTGTAAKAFDAVSGTAAAPEDALAYFNLAGRASRAGQAVWQPAAAGKVGALSAQLSPLPSEIDALRPRVELLIQGQMGAALRSAGVGYRLGALDLSFPPLFFRFEDLPKLLVVSPRAHIDRTATVLLNPALTPEDAERLEASLSDRQYSVLVTQIGGLGVYPSMVPDSSDVRGTLRTVAHEWTHQSLSLRPLGWRYAFGAEKDSRMVTINETVAEMVGREIGDAVYHRYYGGPPPEQARAPQQEDRFRGTMRETRVRVDGLLAQGKVGEAESYMESSRLELARQGYYVRKLNQAYFAFYGSYADEPSMAGRVGENIGRRIHALRERSASLGDFLWRSSGAGRYDEFLRVAPPS